MSTPTAANVRVGKPAITGGILVSPLGTALAVDATSALDAAFVGVGYASEDGVTQSIGTDSKKIVAWGGDEVRTIETSHEVTFKFTMIETNGASLGIYYGASNVTVAAELITVLIKAGDLPHQAWDLEIRDGDHRIRITIGDGQITDRGDISYKDDEAIAYECTLTCYPDADGVKATVMSTV